MLVAMLLLTYPFTWVTVGVSIILVTIGHSTLIYLAYEDPQWWPILTQHMRQQHYYRSSGSSMLFKEYQEPQSYADILPYDSLITPQIVALKAPGLLAAWAYTGPDLDVAAQEEMDVLGQHINTGLLSLGSGWCLHVDLLRCEARQ